MRARWDLQIDRIVITGATGTPPAADALRSLLAQAVTTAVSAAPWPAGRAARAEVQVDAPRLSNGPAIAQAVGRGVAQALKGRPHG